MTTITFSNWYQRNANDLVQRGDENVPYTLTDTTDDGVFTVGEAVTITGSGGPFDGVFLGYTAGGGLVWHWTLDGNDYVFTEEVFTIGEAFPSFTSGDFAVCFGRGTLVATPQGAIAVEDLAAGDLVLTRDNGPQAVRWSGKRRLGADALRLRPALQPIRIAAGALGNDRDLTVSPEHRMLVTGWQAEVLHGVPELLVPAKALVNDSTIRRVIPEEGVEYWHVLFDKHEVIMAEGCWSESLNPDAHALDGLDAAARDEVLGLFPELASGAGLALARAVEGRAVQA